jgi:PAS domain S-box-containing protein
MLVVTLDDCLSGLQLPDDIELVAWGDPAPTGDVMVGRPAAVRAHLAAGHSRPRVLIVGPWAQAQELVGPTIDQVDGVDPVARLVHRLRASGGAPPRDVVDFASLVAASPYLVGMATKEGARRYLNPAGRRMLGYGLDEPIYGRPVVDTFREGPSFQHELIPRVLAEGSWAGDNVVVNRSGESIPVFQVLFRVDVGPHEPPYIATFMRDLRDTKALEARLRSEQDQHESLRALLAALLESWPEVVAITVETTGAPIYLNARGREVFGLGDSDSLPVSLEEFYPRLRHMRAEVFPELEKRGRWSGRNIILDRNGTEIPVHQTLVRVADPAGDRDLVATFIHDLREMELLHERVRTAEAQRRELADRLDSMRGSVDLVAAATVDGHVTLLNESGRKMLGIPLDQPLDRSDFSSFYPPRVLDVVRDGIRRALEFGVWSDEVVMLSSDGTEIPVHQVIVANYDATGRAQYLSTVVRDLRDLDELGRLEARAQRAERDRAVAETAERSKTLFLANMSHEIRTPLNAVLGYAQLLERRSLAPEERSIVTSLRGAGEHLLALIDDVLDVSKLEAGAVVVTPAPVDLARTMAVVADMFRPRCRQRGLEFRFEDELPHPCWVEADDKKLTQILANLLGNAAKFTQEGYVCLSVSSDGDRYRMVVTDTGPGISEEDAASMFSPFSQGRAGASHGGTGLGLSIAKGLVSAMGGELQVGPAQTGGVRAQVQLTLHPSAPRPVPFDLRAARRILRRPAKLLALVVDDVAHNRDVLRRFLAESGIDVVVAEDGLEAVEAVGEHRPDIVLMDLRMPRLDGAAALAQCRVRYPDAPTKYVAVSATSPRAPEAGEGQFDEFLRKPVSLRDVYACLERVLGAEFESVSEPQVVATAPATLPAVDATFARTLGDAAHRGELSKLRRLLADADTDPARAEFVAHVRPFVDRCDLEGLAALLRR